MSSLVVGTLKSAFVFSYGLFTMGLYVAIAMYKGTFFKKTTEKETLELQLARSRLWDLSTNWNSFSHHIHTLRNGFKFHYVSNEPNAILNATKPLVIFIHGFPHTWGLWNHILSEESPQSSATLVALDLPGYGGSESLDKYSATAIFESLTEFIISMRLRYGIDTDAATHQQRTIIVAHDWGCVASMRLAAEAPELADRFILSNGPLMPLVVSNISRRLSSSSKMFKSFLRSPLRQPALLANAIKTLKPFAFQLLMSGYIFVFQLPLPLVAYLGSGGNQCFLKAIQKAPYVKQEYTMADAAEGMAFTLGPSEHEGQTQTAEGQKYAESAITRSAVSSFAEMCKYYRDNAAFSTWRKSVETITSLHGIAKEGGIQRTSSGTGLFDEGPPGALKAPSTILWGTKDHALTPELTIDGISDYLPRNSHLVELPDSEHWTPMEQESRVAFIKATEWAIGGERGDIGAVIGACYPKSSVTVRK